MILCTRGNIPFSEKSSRNFLTTCSIMQVMHTAQLKTRLNLLKHHFKWGHLQCTVIDPWCYTGLFAVLTCRPLKTFGGLQSKQKKFEAQLLKSYDKQEGENLFPNTFPKPIVVKWRDDATRGNMSQFQFLTVFWHQIKMKLYVKNVWFSNTLTHLFIGFCNLCI